MFYAPCATLSAIMTYRDYQGIQLSLFIPRLAATRFMTEPLRYNGSRHVSRAKKLLLHALGVVKAGYKLLCLKTQVSDVGRL